VDRDLRDPAQRLPGPCRGEAAAERDPTPGSPGENAGAMEILRTPDERFENLPGYDFEPHYVEVPNPDGGEPLQMHYVDEGRADAPPVLLLHGEPSWSYLYWKMIPPLADAGLRAVAP